MLKKVEFFKLSKGNEVGTILETLHLSFESKDEFATWAQKALPDRRGDDRIWMWPDAVRASNDEVGELYRWDLWDQITAGKPLVNADRT
jgi:hypothetical protein